MFYILSRKHDCGCSRCWLMIRVGAQLIDYCTIYNSAQSHEAHCQSSRQANVNLQPKEMFNFSSTSFFYSQLYVDVNMSSLSFHCAEIKQIMKCSVGRYLEH